MIISRWVLLKMRNISDESCRENQNTHFVFSNFFPKSCCLWDNVEKYGTARQATDGNIIRRMRFPCWINNATDTLRIYSISYICTAKMVTRTRLNVTLYVYWLSSTFLPLFLDWFRTLHKFPTSTVREGCKEAAACSRVILMWWRG
jgi:hypothetical protein